jgi:hypothetical protein
MACLYRSKPSPTPDRCLRCSRTHRFWKPDGWTTDPEEAARFADEMEAVRACVTHQLQDIELVLLHPEDHTEVFATAIR